MVKRFSPGTRKLIKDWYNQPYINFVERDRRGLDVLVHLSVKAIIDKNVPYELMVETISRSLTGENKWLYIGHMADWWGTPLT